MKHLTLLAFALLMLAPAACTDDSAAPEDDGELATAVTPGKADNYLSPTSREYFLWGIGDVTLGDEYLEATMEEKEAHVKELLGYRFKAYAHFINVYVTDKSSHDDNQDYGGFSGLVRSTTLDWVYEPVDEAGTIWTFIWELEMGGPRDMMDKLPIETKDNGDRYFMVTLPVLTEYQLEYASYPKDFDAATYEGDKEEIEVVVEPQEESFDGWPAYTELFDDGLLDILIVVGGDYNDARYDLKAAESIFDWLKSDGYKHEATDYTELTLESPPFKKSFTADGATIQVEVTLYHPDIVPDAELDSLKEKIIQGYETMDIVIYDGHAGQDPSYSGVVYHYNPRHAIAANDFQDLALPEKYQLYVFNGCKTYSAYPEAVYKNETKTYENLDIVSTVNFSWLSMQTFTTSQLLDELMATRGGTHEPKTYAEILTAINRSGNWNVYYGVHGIDDNEHLNPYADVSTLCDTCKTDADCPGVGNKCVVFEWGKACGAECTADDGCPSGYACADIAVGTQITGRQCLPTTFECGN